MAAQFAHGIRPFDIDGCQDSVWLLGRQYQLLSEDATSDKDGDAQRVAYLRAFKSLVWITYRKDFQSMAPYDITSDSGWGCMLRTGQMILAEGLRRHLGGSAIQDGSAPLDFTRTLLSWFQDSPSRDCFFSIHNMVQVGLQYDKLPGEWYGPTTVSQILRDLVEIHTAKLEKQMVVLVPQEGVIYLDEVEQLCGASDTAVGSNTQILTYEEVSRSTYDPLLNPPPKGSCSIWTKSLYILLPLRLGLHQINGDYLEAIRHIFHIPQTTGIIGGKRGHSVYFVGYHGSELHLLDPHTVQPALLFDQFGEEQSYSQTVSSTSPLLMNINSVDPSLAIGFYCRDRSEFCQMRLAVEKLKEHCFCPFSVAERKPDYASEVDMVDENLSGNESDEEDEYVVIESTLH